MDCFHTLMSSAGQNRIVVYIVVGFFFLRELPWLIAAFRVAIVQDDKAKAKRARDALGAIAPRWHWIWRKRG